MFAPLLLLNCSCANETYSGKCSNTLVGSQTRLVGQPAGAKRSSGGDWAAAKHGKKGKRGWKKLHLGVDRAGLIVAQVLTDSNVDDANTGVDLIRQVSVR